MPPTLPTPRFLHACSSAVAWRHPDAGAYAALWSPDGQTVVAVSHTTVAYAVDTGLPRWQHRRARTRVGFVLSHRQRPAVLLAGGTDPVDVVDLDTGELVKTLDVSSSIESGAARPGGGFALGTAGGVLVYDADFARVAEARTDTAGMVFQLGYSPDGRWLVASQLGAAAALFDGVTPTLLRRLGTPDQPALRAVLLQGGRVVLCDHGADGLRAWDTATGAPCGVSPLDAGPVTWLDAPGCGEDFFAIVHGADLYRGRVGEAAVRGVDTQREPLQAFAVSPDGTQWALVLGPRVQRYDAATGLARDRFDGHLHPVTGLFASGHRDAVVSVDSGGTARMWSLPALVPGVVDRGRSHERVRTLVAMPEGDAVCLVDPLPDGERVVDFAAGTIARTRVLGPDVLDRWHAAGVTVLRESRRLRVQRDDGTRADIAVRIERGALSPDGRRFAALAKGKLTVLDTATLQPIGHAKATMATGLAWGTRPDRLVVHTPRTALLFDADTVTKLAEHTPPGQLVWDLATSRVDARLAVNAGHAVTLLGLDDFAPLCGPLTLPSFAPRVALSRDDRWLLTGHHDGCVYTWDVAAWRRDTAAEATQCVVKLTRR
jgi:WD40 repeat protein